MRTRNANRQAGAFRLESAPALPVLVGRAFIVAVVLAEPVHSQRGSRTINRLNAARGQPDITRTGRTGVGGSEAVYRHGPVLPAKVAGHRITPVGRVDPIFRLVSSIMCGLTLSPLRSVGVTAGSSGCVGAPLAPGRDIGVPVVLGRRGTGAPCSCAVRDELKVSLWAARLSWYGPGMP